MAQIRPNRRPGRAVSLDEVNQLLSACGKGAAGARNAAFIALTYGAGLRCREALQLKPRDIYRSVDGVVIQVVSGKGNKSRQVTMDLDFRLYLERWLEKREHLGITARSPVICGITESNQENALGGSRGTKGKPVSAALMRSTVARLAKKAGIEQRVHVHGLRHGFATLAEREGMKLAALQAQLGHSSLATTANYIAKHSVQERLDFMAERQRRRRANQSQISQNKT
jgi:integrase